MSSALILLAKQNSSGKHVVADRFEAIVRHLSLARTSNINQSTQNEEATGMLSVESVCV